MVQHNTTIIDKKDKLQGEQINQMFFELEERIDACEFLKRFHLYYVEPEDFKGITVINHCHKFWNEFPLAYRHTIHYNIGRIGM